MNTILKENAVSADRLGRVEINGEIFYKIENVDTMRPFFMSIVSDSDHWLFLSSNGGITAGRKNAEYALFPYYTDDKITDTAEITGSKTIIRVYKNGETIIWEPFSVRSEGNVHINRNLYQNRFSNKIIFEEINHALGLCFQYEWNSSNLYGFVKQSRLKNISGITLHIEVLDGLQNIMPHGVPSDLQTKTSNLADAYKRSELIAGSGLGIFALSAIIVDKAEPSEALKANVVWSIGLSQPKYLLSALQLQAFRKGKPVNQEEDIKGEKGAYFINAVLLLEAGEEKQWMIIANVNQNHSAVISLDENIKTDKSLWEKVQHDIRAGSAQLQQLNAAADGFQFTADELKDTRHFSNVLFNIMRGGIFDNNYQVEKWDFSNYLQKANKKVYEKASSYVNALPENFSVFELSKIANESGDIDFIRLAAEYLPLKFSRRHGDPSRPWNQFSINTRSETDGSKILNYQGNWRDIFQNWEALVHSYPAFIEGMIYKFLNASTFDGYNPYRVTKDGFDWETIEPDNPWSYIGYWGDHQVIYLLKFLEFAEQYQPGAVEKLLNNNGFVYANVPYRIKSFAAIVKNPKDTIEFDHSSEKRIHERMMLLGADGALLTNINEEIQHVNFLEKILAVTLSKLSNFIPEAGIWMNTQRPEWNDANNALVGNGVSMVTLCYLRRFLNFFQTIFQQTGRLQFEVSEELHAFFNTVAAIFSTYANTITAPVSDAVRKDITDALGTAGSNYRYQVYTHRFSGKKKTISAESLFTFTTIAKQFLDHSIRANKRADKLYHAYNLLTYTNDGIQISHLSEMLEGQVAVLSSGYLTAGESLHLLDALRQSALYRADQNSYILYPDKQLPGFLQKNNILQDLFEGSALLTKLLQDGNTAIAERDINGNYHFNGNFKNADDLLKALNGLEASYQLEVAKEKSAVLQIFETVFNHKEFTGRSGTFYGYEGLGSIYWHMVSKLLLAVQENCLSAIRNNAAAEISDQLIAHYYQINDGIGVHKSPSLYGAFPVTPYSHTPLNRGAQQPGMTGQVKEDILCRLGELGMQIQNGQLVFDPVMLNRGAFLSEKKEVVITDVHERKLTLALQKNSLLFTCCQVPVVYRISDSEYTEIAYTNGQVTANTGLAINKTESAAVLNRTGMVKQITVYLKEDLLRH